MSNDHKVCDDAFIEFENIISQKDWPLLKTRWNNFCQKLLSHFEMEEQVLFPAFETATGMTSGPTAVMRSEHQQMRTLVGEIEQALTHNNMEDCQAIADTLMVMIQQHNMKEEHMLYPMSDQHTNSQEVIAKMQDLIRD